MKGIPAGYKQTEVGVIPEDWEVFNLESITDPKRAISYGIVQTGPNIQNGIRCLRVVDIEDGKINSRDMITTSKTISDSYKRTILKAEDLVMPLRGKVGDIAIVKDDLAGCNLTRGVALIAVRPDWSARYCRQYISSASTRNRLEQSMNGSALQEIPIASLRSFKIALPPTKAEQEAIAEALSDTDALIESLEQLIAKKRHLKQGVMQELLTGKKRLPGFQSKNGFGWCELGFIPEDWQCQQLPKLTAQGKSSIKIGPFGSALKKEYLTKDGFKVYGQENLYEKNMDIGDRFISSEHFRKLRSCEIKADDFLVSMMGTVGKCQIVPTGIKEGIMDSHLLRIRLDSGKLSSDYLSQLFETKIVFDQVKQLSVGGIMEGLSSKIIKSLNLPVPTVEEQISIAKVLSDMDTEIAALETKLAKTRQLKQGMMHNLLTGRIRLL